MIDSLALFQEATFQGGDVKLSKYLDSFPFPYYVVLKNIEALPRTLADLLRQVMTIYTLKQAIALFQFQICFTSSDDDLGFPPCSGLSLCNTQENRLLNFTHVKTPRGI